MHPTELVRLVRELGPVWGVVTLAMLALFGVARYRWESGSDTVQTLLADPVVGIVALAALLGTLLYLVVYYFAFYRGRGLPAAFAGNEVGILVAAVPGDEDRRLQQTYAQAIRALIAQTSDLCDAVRVRLLDRPLSSDPDRQHQDALRLGKRLGACFVLRAIRVEAGYQTWVTLVHLPDFSKPEAHLGKVNEQQLAELDTLALPSQVTLLARCALALSLYRSEQYDTAGRLLREIIEFGRLPPGSPARPYLLKLLGDCRVAGRFSAPASIIPMAIAAYDEALKEWVRERNPREWADTMMNRAIAYLALPHPNVIANLEEALRSCELALAVHTRDKGPERWARATWVRATACLNFPEASRCEEAVGYLDRALEALTRRRHAYLWALTIRNRGLAYHRLYLCTESSSHKQKAEADFRRALKILTRSKYPYDWGITLLSLASLYIVPPDVDRCEEAAESLDTLESFFTKDRYPAEWAMMTRLCGTFYFLASAADNQLLTRSVDAYSGALEVFDRAQYPIERAITLAALGVVYQVGSDRDSQRAKEYLELAVSCCEEAASIYDEQGFDESAANARAVGEDARRKLIDPT